MNPLGEPNQVYFQCFLLACPMTCGVKQLSDEESSYKKLRRQKIEANTIKLESLGLLALAAAVKPATEVKR